MIAVDIDGVRFNYRVAAVCIDEDHVLLNRIAGMDFWFLPGGRCEVRETSAESLVREMQEELGVTARVERLLWFVENFFESPSQLYHEIGLYYKVLLPAGSSGSDKQREYQSRTESGDDAVFRWFPLDALRTITLVPAFLRQGLQLLPAHPEYLVTRS